MGEVRRFLQLCAFYLLMCAAVHAQVPNLVRGIVVDSATFEALPSVNIQLKGSSVGTATDEKGNFSIAAGPGDTLIFTLVGYKRLELPLYDYEPGIIRMSEQYTLLEAVTIDEDRAGQLYEGMFDEQNARLKKNIPFYLSKAKKEKIKVQSLKEENLRVKTYVDVVINDPQLRRTLMQKHALTEEEYYQTLTAFNEKHYRVMYYLTRAELVSLINTFFETYAR